MQAAACRIVLVGPENPLNVGFVARAMLAARFPQYQHGRHGTMRDEAVQVAAVAVAFVQMLDRHPVEGSDASPT